jgi:signal transduction histidine kinase
MQIEIADDGPGIPAAMREKVFENFFKANNARSSDKSGFGLGLSIAQDIIKRHEGDIGLHGRDPSGLIVHIALPAQSALDSM